jgi:DNA-directed RNA polymerase subunit alpha
LTTSPKAKKKEEPLGLGMLDLTVEELDLPTRIANALRRGGYGTLRDLSTASKADLAKVKNLGEKSIKVVEAALVKKGVKLKAR